MATATTFNIQIPEHKNTKSIDRHDNVYVEQASEYRLSITELKTELWGLKGGDVIVQEMPGFPIPHDVKLFIEGKINRLDANFLSDAIDGTNKGWRERLKDVEEKIIIPALSIMQNDKNYSTIEYGGRFKNTLQIREQLFENDIESKHLDKVNNNTLRTTFFEERIKDAIMAESGIAHGTSQKISDTISNVFANRLAKTTLGAIDTTKQQFSIYRDADENLTVLIDIQPNGHQFPVDSIKMVAPENSKLFNILMTFSNDELKNMVKKYSNEIRDVGISIKFDNQKTNLHLIQKAMLVYEMVNNPDHAYSRNKDVMSYYHDAMETVQQKVVPHDLVAKYNNKIEERSHSVKNTTPAPKKIPM